MRFDAELGRSVGNAFDDEAAAVGGGGGVAVTAAVGLAERANAGILEGSAASSPVDANQLDAEVRHEAGYQDVCGLTVAVS